MIPDHIKLAILSAINRMAQAALAIFLLMAVAGSMWPHGSLPNKAYAVAGSVVEKIWADPVFTGTCLFAMMIAVGVIRTIQFFRQH